MLPESYYLPVLHPPTHLLLLAVHPYHPWGLLGLHLHLTGLYGGERTGEGESVPAGRIPGVGRKWRRKFFQSGSDGKASVYDAGDPGSIPGLGRSLGEGNSNLIQYYCLENPMDRGVWYGRLQCMGSQRVGHD